MSVEAKSSAFPEASFAIEFAVTGANKIISHHLDNDTVSYTHLTLPTNREV